MIKDTINIKIITNYFFKNILILSLLSFTNKLLTKEKKNQPENEISMV
ncbi:hypothetical protein HDC90_004670 [Pedobacter sp. AK013]|nr:hypothetical protein [Pedobacter sp. AK013]